MRFKNTKKFAPVIYSDDKPWEFDLFHIEKNTLPMSEKGIETYLMDNPHIDVDIPWWNEQRRRCLEGFLFNDGIEPGGDFLADGVDAFWNEGTEPEYIREIKMVLQPNTCYVPVYDWFFQNRDVYLTNRHYWYLNFWKVYGLEWSDDEVMTDSKAFKEMQGEPTIFNPNEYNFKNLHDTSSAKQYVNPKFTDIDFWFFVRLFNMFRYEKNGSEHKSRQKGFSEKAGGGILGWNYTFVKSSVNIVAGGMSDDAEHTVENSIKGLNELRNTQFYKETSRNSGVQFREAKYFGSTIQAISCRDNAQALSRLTPYVVIFEEIGKWKKGIIQKAIQFIEVSQEAEATKTGWNLYIGTGGDMELGAEDLEHIHHNPDEYHLLKYDNRRWEPQGLSVSSKTGHFTPYYLYLIIDKDGNSLVVRSKEFAQKKRDLLSGEALYIHRTQRPFYASEAFLVSGGGFFGEMVVEWLNNRITDIKLRPDTVRAVRGVLRWKTDINHWHDGVEFVVKEDGWLEVYEEPQLNSSGNVYEGLYEVATDSYDQDEATTDSLGSCSVKKGFLNAQSSYNKYVAQILERPPTSEGGRELFYEHTAMVSVWYGRALNLIEWSKILIIDWYRNHKFESLLRPRPRFLTARFVGDSKAKNDYGIDPSTKPFWLKMHKEYLSVRSNIEQCDSVLMLTRWAKFKYEPGREKKYNCDVTISTSLATVAYEENKDEMIHDEKEKEDDKVRHIPGYVRRGGKLVFVTKVYV